MRADNTAQPAGEDHPRFKEKVGATVAKLVRETKPEVGPLAPRMNIELDLAYDSPSRVELLSLAEARLGVNISEHQAARIFTLGDLMESFEAASAAGSAGAWTWQEIRIGTPGD